MPKTDIGYWIMMGRKARRSVRLKILKGANQWTLNLSIDN